MVARMPGNQRHRVFRQAATVKAESVYLESVLSQFEMARASCPCYFMAKMAMPLQTETLPRNLPNNEPDCHTISPLLQIIPWVRSRHYRKAPADSKRLVPMAVDET